MYCSLQKATEISELAPYHWGRFLAKCRNGSLWASYKIFYTVIRFLDQDLLTKSDILAIWAQLQLIFYKLAESLPYFYFQSIRPIDLESESCGWPHDGNFLIARLQRFCCWYIICPCNLELLTLDNCHIWRVTWLTRPSSLKILCLSVLELWVMISLISHHWQCIRSHCTCAISRGLRIEIRTTLQKRLERCL